MREERVEEEGNAASEGKRTRCVKQPLKAGKVRPLISLFYGCDRRYSHATSTTAPWIRMFDVLLPIDTGLNVFQFGGLAPPAVCLSGAYPFAVQVFQVRSCVRV